MLGTLLVNIDLLSAQSPPNTFAGCWALSRSNERSIKPGLRGKTTRKKTEHVRVDYVEIPRDLVDMHKYVTLVADVMFVNGLPFLVTSSRGISLVTIEYLPSRTAKRLALTLERMINV